MNFEGADSKGKGSVYAKVIDEVIQSSQLDFRDSGVDSAVLEELRKAWQDKLSILGVAAFPWEPTSAQVPKAEDIVTDGTRIQPDPESDLPLLPSPSCKSISNDNLNAPLQDVSSITSATATVPSVAPKPLQTDRPEMDKDAINSDLDHSDGELVGSSDGENTPHIVMGAYDRVGRGNSKWIIRMSNVFLTVNGREYVPLLHLSPTL
ncbi:hypothetical protein ABW20_dc0102680 [Dactylellina cionopaga]|nr:hypothetical protein ABW20_dc0102680 [Dactylellina cionopaga]